MKTIKYFMMFTLLLMFATIANAAPNIVGNYYCKGYDPYSDIKYGGPVAIKKTGHTYAVTWNLGENQFYTGTGMLNENTNIFSVLFYNDQSVKNAGLSVYQVMSDGSLRGTWVMNGEDKIGTENCVRQ